MKDYRTIKTLCILLFSILSVFCFISGVSALLKTQPYLLKLFLGFLFLVFAFLSPVLIHSFESAGNGQSTKTTNDKKPFQGTNPVPSAAFLSYQGKELLYGMDETFELVDGAIGAAVESKGKTISLRIEDENVFLAYSNKIIGALPAGQARDAILKQNDELSFICKVTFADVLQKRGVVHLDVYGKGVSNSHVLFENESKRSDRKKTKEEPAFSFKLVKNGFFLKYTYEDSFEILNNHLSNAIESVNHKLIFFVDNDSVFVRFGGLIIGELKKGLIRDMVIDYTRKDFFFTGKAISVDLSNKALIFQIGFYLPLEKTDSKVFQLQSLKHKDEDGERLCDNLDLCSEGEEVEIEEEDDSFCVYGAHGKIGFLPATFENYIESFDGDIYAEICSIENNDEGDATGSVIVYLLDCNKMKSFID